MFHPAPSHPTPEWVHPISCKFINKANRSEIIIQSIMCQNQFFVSLCSCNAVQLKLGVENKSCRKDTKVTYSGSFCRFTSNCSLAVPIRKVVGSRRPLGNPDMVANQKLRSSHYVIAKSTSFHPASRSSLPHPPLKGKHVVGFHCIDLD